MKRLLRWLYPGLRVKRWLALILIGVGLITLGVMLFLDTGVVGINNRLAQWFTDLSGAEFFSWIWGVVAIVLGLIVMLLALRQLVRSITSVVSPQTHGRLAETIYQKRHLSGGPRIVTIGGGTGLSTLLRGLKETSGEIAALVAVSDDGGSSGRLRREMGMPPPGDIRNCLVALAEAEPLMTELFQYRFPEAEAKSLDGHSFGNLLIAAMTAITGDFERAVRETSKVLAIRGRVLPSTLQDVRLKAQLADGSTIEGESKIGHCNSPIVKLMLDPPDAEPLEEAIEAILNAEAIIAGPGSLFTSVMPNLLVKGMVPAIRRSNATTIYICNVMTQPGETNGFTASAHLRALICQLGCNPFRYVLVNKIRPAPEVLAAYAAEGAQFVEPDFDQIAALGSEPIPADVLSRTNLARHDPHRLAAALMPILMQGKETVPVK